MHTFLLESLNDLTFKNERLQTLEDLQEIAARGNQASVQCEYFAVRQETHLYGVYEKTEQEVKDYDHSGGLWEYRDAKTYLRFLLESLYEEALEENLCH